jgi:hypothetical protein
LKPIPFHILPRDGFLHDSGPTCEVATSTIEPPNDLKKLLEERASHQQEEPPQENQLPVQRPTSPQQQQ